MLECGRTFIKGKTFRIADLFAHANTCGDCRDRVIEVMHAGDRKLHALFDEAGNALTAGCVRRVGFKIFLRFTGSGIEKRKLIAFVRRILRKIILNEESRRLSLFSALFAGKSTEVPE